LDSPTTLVSMFVSYCVAGRFSDVIKNCGVELDMVLVNSLLSAFS